MIRYDDWTFLAEGGHHVVLRFHGSDPVYKGHVLRIEKIIPSVTGKCDRTNIEGHYVTNVMEPILSSSYINHPQLVTVDSAFVTQLNRHLKLDSTRIRSEYVDVNCCTAYIFRDITTIPRLSRVGNDTEEDDLPLINEGRQLSVEIKIKCGFKSVSPFASRRIKHSTSRYKLNQFAKLYQYQKNKIGMKYGGKFPGISQYDPADVCSRERHRVRHSLNCLLQNPQNNLKVCYHGKHIYGLHLCQVTQLTEGCAQLFSHISSTIKSPIDTLTLVISEILCVESALERLKYAQSLDILDVEGTHRVFEVFCRHVMKMKSDEFVDETPSPQDVEKFALGIITDSMASGMYSTHPPLHEDETGGGHGTRDDPSGCLLNSLQRQLHLRGETPEADGSTSHTLGERSIDSGARGCQCVLHRLQRYQVNEGTPLTELDSIRRKCAAEIDALNTVDCLFLLKQFLVSLAASDASVAITLSEVSVEEWNHSIARDTDGTSCSKSNTETHSNSEVLNTGTERDNADISISALQTKSPGEGYIQIKCLDTGATSYIFYKVTFLDLGPKPAGKIVDKMKKESILCAQAEDIHEGLLGNL